MWTDKQSHLERSPVHDNLATFRKKEKKKTADQWELMLIKQRETHEKLLRKQSAEYAKKIEKVTSTMKTERV
jgi:hypothetical protein